MQHDVKVKFNLAMNDFQLVDRVNKGMRQNVLINNPILQPGEFPRFDARLVSSGLPNLEDLESFNLKIQQNQISETPVALRCLSQQKHLLENATGIIALGAVFVLEEDPIRLQADESTIIYNHNSSRTRDTCFLDVCAGGFGGWSTAATMLMHHNHAPFKKLIGVDIDQAAMQQWCINHKAAYIDT